MSTHEGEGGRSGEGRSGRGRAPRHGSAWTDEENERLVAEIASGTSVAAVAAAHGRSEQSIRAQLEAMAPEWLPLDKSKAVQWVVRRLRGGESLDWRTALRSRRRVYWSQDDDAALHAAWGAEHDLPRVARQVGMEELDVHKRLLVLGLSDSYRATVERMGCSPAGVVHARYQREVGQAPEAVAVLMIWGPVQGAPRVIGVPGMPSLVLLCSSVEAARAGLGVVRRVHNRATGNQVGRPRGEVSWTIALRAVDSDRNIGKGESGTVDPDE